MKMRQLLKSKNGFTLVELLAVIVILALIMSIAIYSISGILQNSREGVFKDSALGIIKGVRMQLLSINNQAEGTYFFTDKLVENNNDLPFGGKINYGNFHISSQVSYDSATNSYQVVDSYFVNNYKVEYVKSSSGNTSLYKYKDETNTQITICNNNTPASFVNVTQNGNKYEYKICLIPTSKEANSRYIWGTEEQLLGSSTQVIFRMMA